MINSLGENSLNTDHKLCFFFFPFSSPRRTCSVLSREEKWIVHHFTLRLIKHDCQPSVPFPVYNALHAYILLGGSKLSHIFTLDALLTGTLGLTSRRCCILQVFRIPLSVNYRSRRSSCPCIIYFPRFCCCVSCFCFVRDSTFT